MTFRRTILLALLSSSISALLLTGSSTAQTLYEQTSGSFITIAGTSTLHEWTMTSKEASYLASFEVDEKGIPLKLNSLSLKVRIESLKSGHTGMDKNAYSTLNTDVYKTITFSLVSANIVNTKIQCDGNLTVSGVTKRMGCIGALACKGRDEVHQRLCYTGMLSQPRQFNNGNERSPSSGNKLDIAKRPVC